MCIPSKPTPDLTTALSEVWRARIAVDHNAVIYITRADTTLAVADCDPEGNPCAIGLSCGSNNCRKYHPTKTSNSWWGSGMNAQSDCCQPGTSTSVLCCRSVIKYEVTHVDRMCCSQRKNANPIVTASSTTSTAAPRFVCVFWCLFRSNLSHE